MIRKPISQFKKIVLGILSVVIFCVGYSYLSYNQKLKNPKDTTMPSFSEMFMGLKTVITPSKANVSYPFYIQCRTAELTNSFGLTNYKVEKWIENNVKINPQKRVIQKSEINRYLGEVKLFSDFKATYWRLFVGLALSSVCAIIFGMLMGHFSTFEALSLPLLSLLAFVPATAAMAVFFSLAGTGEYLYLSIIFFATFPTMARSIYLSASKDVINQEINKFLTMGASVTEVLFELSFKKLFPRILGIIRLTIGPTMIALIAIEYLMSSVGFGYRLRMESRILNMNICYIYCIFLSLTGLLIDTFLVKFSNRFCTWFHLER